MGFRIRLVPPQISADNFLLLPAEVFSIFLLSLSGLLAKEGKKKVWRNAN